MPDEPSRLLGLAGLRVTGVVVGDGDALDLEVESVARERGSFVRWIGAVAAMMAAILVLFVSPQSRR